MHIYIDIYKIIPIVSISIAALTLWWRFAERYATKSLQSFGGKWSVDIDWNACGADFLFGQAVGDAHSTGYLVLALGEGPRGRARSTGHGDFKLKAGFAVRSNVCVRVRHVDQPYRRPVTALFLRTYTLEGFDIQTVFRKEVGEFRYGPQAQEQANYRMVFVRKGNSVTTDALEYVAKADCLRGAMLRDTTVVASVKADRM